MDNTGIVPNLFLDPSERSALMSKIRSKDTKPELIVFLALKARGVTFQRHYARVEGKPDLARPRKKLAVFIDGDFWHGREIERVIEQRGEDSPWVRKLRRNIQRDEEQEIELRRRGWDVLRVWESDIMRVGTRTEVVNRIQSFLASRD